MSNEPKVAIVTGASQGIGRAIALALAESGFALALAARNQAALSSLAGAIRKSGGRAEAIPTDVSISTEVASMVAAAERQFGGVDLLVNNAGIVLRQAVVDTDEAAWDRLQAVNLKGAFLCTKAVLEGMIARGRGRIVNVSSISGKLGTPFLSAYCASKWGLLGFSKATAEEVRPHGIQVFSLCPGSVNTDMLQRGLPGAEPDMEPEAVAKVVVYLATEAPDAMTGAAIDVFG